MENCDYTDYEQDINDVLKGFSDEPAGQQATVTQKDAEEARSFIYDFMQYIKSGAFKNDVNENAKKYNLKPKALAKNFIDSILGTVGDVLGIAISTVGDTAHTLVNILSTVVHGTVNVVTNIASAIARMITLNKTCVGA